LGAPALSAGASLLQRGPSLADHSSPKAGRGTELLALRKELKAIEEKRSEEALKLLGEVSDRRQVGCFWLVASVLMLLSCGVVWLVRYPDGTHSTTVLTLAALALLGIVLCFSRLRQARRADEVAEEVIGGFDRRASELRERIEDLEMAGFGGSGDGASGPA